MAEIKNHLWIPDGEIDNVEKKPTGRSNQYGLEHTDHGQKLSQGLQSIVDFSNISSLPTHSMSRIWSLSKSFCRIKKILQPRRTLLKTKV